MTEADATLSMLKQRLMLSFWLFNLVLIFGTSGYWVLADGRHGLIDCLYMTVITVTTVGYAEVVDLSGSPGGRLFTITLIFAGMGIILYFVSNVTAFLIDGSLKEIFARKRMKKMISEMNGHFIVCGVGAIGVHAVDELSRTGRMAVAIDMNEERINALGERCPGLATIVGDAAENDVLEEAGLHRAAGILVATDNDKDNIVTTISVRQLNSDIRIVARCSDTKHAEKLRRAGASAVVTSNYIGGLRMVSEMVRPTVVTFLDTMLRDSEKTYRIEEARICEGSSLAGRSVAELRKTVLLLAIVPAKGGYVFNPDDSLRIQAGSTIVFMGSPQDRQRVDELAGAWGQAS